MLRFALLPAALVAAFAVAAPLAPLAPPPDGRSAPTASPAPSPPSPGDRAYAHALRGQAEAWRRWAEDFGNDLHASMGTMFVSRIGSSAIVKGAPYSAEVITERKQHLADGNTIAHATHGRVYRDGSGRMRQETEGRDGKPGTVFIDDAVAGMRYILLSGRKHVVAFPDPRKQPAGMHHSESAESDGTEVRIEDGKAFVNGKPVDPGKVHVVRSASGKELRIENGRIFVDGHLANQGAEGQNVTVVSREHEGLTREMIRIEAIRSDDGMPVAPAPPAPPIPPLPPTAPGEVEAPIAPLPPMPGVSTLRFESTAKLGRGETRSLGTKDFDGIRADGHSTVWTIPAGQVGNVKPIAITSESWYSPELQVTVYSRYDDPRVGESIYRLKDIRRAEPPAQLFKADAK